MNNILIKILQGMLIGLGAVLPGISGGVLCVIFGIYRPVMEFLGAPFSNFKNNIKMLMPYIIGAIIGFLGVSKLLGIILINYPSQSVCLFVGLIGGMLPALFTEAKKEGRNNQSKLSLIISMLVVFTLLMSLKYLSIEVKPTYFAYIFCGVCLALSLIAPGLSFSTLLMPLGLYTPFVSGIGDFKVSVLLPAGVGALITLVLLTRLINVLFEKYYSNMYHGIIGVVLAATIMIIPFDSFMISAVNFLMNMLCIGLGVLISICISEFNEKNKMDMTM